MTHTVFLTGASGFLGQHLLRELRQRGVRVRALSRRAESDATLQAAGAEPVRGSLEDSDSLRRALQGCDAVFHAAADTSVWRGHAARQTATNVQGTLALLHAATQAGAGAFVHTSSVSAFSHLAHGVLNEDSQQRGAQSWINYERTKHQGEAAVRASAVPWIVFNPSHILGPGDWHNWSRLIVMVQRGRLPGIPPGAGAFADVREVARAQVRAWEQQRFGQRYLLGGVQASFVEFVREAGRLLDKPVPRRATPTWALMAYARLLDLGARMTQREPAVTPEGAAMTSHTLRVDSSKAIRELDYRETPLPQLMADTVAWMRDERLLPPA